MNNRIGPIGRALMGVAAVVCCMLVAPLFAAAQPVQRPLRIGFMAHDRSLLALPSTRALVDGLRDLGYVEGRHFAWEFCATDSRPERILACVSELIQLPVDIFLFGICGTGLDAVRRATQTIPIVVASCNDDMVETGIVKSLARPGGNITGLSKLTPELAPKRLQLLKQVVPGAARIAVLWNPGYSDFKADWRELRAAAQKLGVTLLPVEFRRPDDLDPAFATIARERVDALITFSDALTYIFAQRVADLASAHRIPSLFAFREVTEAGALMSYGPSLPGMWRRAASYIDRIVKGAKPGDLPIEQPTRFELVVNRKAAAALGLTIPQSVLLLADRVVD